MVINLDEFEVLTERGFKDFSGIKKSIKDNYFHIKFDDNTDLKCSYEHRIKVDNKFVYAHELIVGTVVNNKHIISIDFIDEKIDVFDLLNVKDTNSYITNGVISHNCAFVQNWDEFFASVFPTISSGESTKILLTSTPNGLNHFYKTCEGAKNGTNGYEYVEVSWERVPGRDEKWRKEILASMDFDQEKFAQEFECQWLGSSGTLIAGWKLKELVHQIPITEKDGLSQFKQPQKNHSYVIICDVSRGKGLDYSAFSVIDVSSMPYDQVCVYHNNMITPIDYADVIYRVAKAYNNASVLVEINDIGEQVSSSLHYDFEYDNVLMTENAGRSGKRVSTGFGGGQDKGIRTTKTVKATGCAILKLLIEQNQLVINDFTTIQELSTFSRKGTSYEAEEGKHDDMVMPLVLFAWLSDQQYFKDYTDINTLVKLREKSEEDVMNDLSPFGFVDDGRNDLSETLDLSPQLGWMFLENEIL